MFAAIRPLLLKLFWQQGIPPQTTLAALHQIDVNMLDFCVFIESVASHFAAKTALPIPTKRCVRVENVVLVDPDGTGANAAGYCQCVL
jgi:hypothetical protein